MSDSGLNAAGAASSSRRSTDRNSMSRPLGGLGLRREKPTTSQPAERNFSIEATPSRPLAPVTSTLFVSFFSIDSPFSCLIPRAALHCLLIRAVKILICAIPGCKLSVVWKSRLVVLEPRGDCWRGLFSRQRHSQNILPQQIHGYSQENEILQKKSN